MRMVDPMAFFNQATAAAGKGGNPFAAQFELTPEQTVRATEAMLPMIAALLQRQLSDPQALAKWGNYLAAMPTMPLPPNEAATQATAKLLGSPEIADALAGQISASAGVGQAVAKAMLPWATALMVGAATAASTKPGTDVGTIADSVTGAMKPVLATIPNPIGPNSFVDDTFGEFVRGYNRGRPVVPPEPDLSEAEKLLQQMVDQSREAQAAQIEAFEAMLDGWFGRK